MANDYLLCLASTKNNYPNDELAQRAFALEYVYMVEHNTRGRKWDNDKRLHEHVSGRSAKYNGWDSWSQSADRQILEAIVKEYEALLGYEWRNGRAVKVK